MTTWKEALGRGEVLVMMKCKLREAMAMACSLLQVDKMYLNQEKALVAFLNEVTFSSARSQSISDPSSDLNKNMISLQNRKKTRTAAGFIKQY